MTRELVKQAIDYALAMTEPKNKKESFMILASLNLLNDATKQVDFRKTVSYGFIKPRATRLFEYYIACNGKIPIDAVYYNPEEKCMYFRIYGLQISFHDIIGKHDALREFAASPRNVKMQWSGIRLQTVAESLFLLAVRNINSEIDVSGEVVKILNEARKLSSPNKRKKRQ